MTSPLEDTFAFQLNAAGLTGYVREYAAIPGRKFRWDFAFVSEKVLIEIQGGTYNGGAHGRGTGIHRDCEKARLASQHGWYTMPFDTKDVKNLDVAKEVHKVLEQRKSEQLINHKQEQK